MRRVLIAVTPISIFPLKGEEVWLPRATSLWIPAYAGMTVGARFFKTTQVVFKGLRKAEKAYRAESSRFLITALGTAPTT